MTHAERLAKVEDLIEQAASAPPAERARLLRDALYLWEISTRDESTPADVMHIEAMLTSLGVAPAKHHDM